MLQRVTEKLKNKETRNIALVGVGMATLLTGARLPALALFAKGFKGLEDTWREKNHFDGTFKERWARSERFYEFTHKDPTNRALHMVGIPMIVGGAAGLLAFRPLGPTFPLWWGSATSFTVGWGLNLVGHKFFEGNAPAFQEDPLSFVAGPVWDVKQVLKSLGSDDAQPDLKVAAK